MAATKRYKNKYDWEAIEAEYRADQRSIKEIAREFGCTDGAIRKRAKKHGWQRDLTEKIQQQVRDELVREQVREENRGVSDKEIIEAAGKRGADIVRSHRKDINKHLKAIETLTLKFDRAVVLEEERQEQLRADIEAQKPGIEEEQGKELNSSLNFLQRAASISVTLSSSLKSLIALERQAWNLDEKGETDDIPTMILHDPRHPERHG